MNLFDEGTINHKEINIWYFFTQIIHHTFEVVLMDGDISQRSLRFAASFGKMLYERNNSNETTYAMTVINDPAKWEDGLHKDIDKFKNSDPNVKICIVAQSYKQTVSLHDHILRRHPELKINMLTRAESGITKMLNIAMKHWRRVFAFSPVIESGVDVTMPTKNIYIYIYGVLSSPSNSR